jgi:hypothetical protein
MGPFSVISIIKRKKDSQMAMAPFGSISDAEKV